MWRLFYPLRYFSLINNEKKHIDFWPTLALAVILALPFIIIPGSNFFAEGVFLDKLLGLISALTGFYVAALVAAATFTHPDLDKTIHVGAIALVTKDQDGHLIQELLTRREFACTVFGYLAFATLVLSLAAAFFVSLHSISVVPMRSLRWVGALFEPTPWLVARGVVVFLFSMAIAHVTVVTSLGLYYLMDRLYRREPKVTTRKERDAA